GSRSGRGGGRCLPAPGIGQPTAAAPAGLCPGAGPHHLGGRDQRPKCAHAALYGARRGAGPPPSRRRELAGEHPYRAVTIIVGPIIGTSLRSKPCPVEPRFLPCAS